MQQSEEAMQRLSSRKVTWYALAALALVAFVALSRERTFMTKLSEQQTAVIDATSGIKSSSRPKAIRQISILGERNSGTRWTYRYVSHHCCVSLTVASLSLTVLFASLDSHLSTCFNHTLHVSLYCNVYILSFVTCTYISLHFIR